MEPVPSPAMAASAEADWVGAELIRRLMATVKSARYTNTPLLAIVVAVLWTDASLAALAIWSAASVTMIGLRNAMLRHYYRDSSEADVAAQRDFMRRYGWYWPASACIWGLSTLLHFDRSPLADQFICSLILAGIGMFSINSFSSFLPAMRGYVNVLGGTMVAVMLWHMGVQLRFQGPSYHYWMLLLVVIYWQVLLQAGGRLHLMHRRSLELQFRNNRLIASLTRETQAALDAVTVKNRFLASAAHDLRQPVHALGLYADLLTSEPQMAHDVAPKIVESTKAVNALFDSLFDLARLDSGTVKLNIEPVDLRKLMRDLELQYRPLAEAKGLEFRLHYVPCHAVSDPILLGRLVGNLVANAVKYTREGGVLLALRPMRGPARIEVWDTGIGIAPEHQQSVFAEFFKVPQHAGTEDGFGLGLHLVARHAHILGHRLELVSRPGRGTVFRLTLDPSDPVAAAARARAAVTQAGRSP